MSNQRNGTNLQADIHQRYEQLVASIDGIVWEIDVPTFQFTFVSRQAEHLLGYPLEQWLEPGFWVHHLHPDDREWAAEFCLQATSAGRNHDFEYRMIAADGRTVWLRDIVSVIVEGGEATTLRGVMIDITDRKRTERELQRSNDLLRAIIDAAPTAIIGLDLDGNVQTVWNAAAEQMLGWRAVEVMGRPLPSVQNESQEEFKGFRERIRRGETLRGVEVRRQRRDGSPIDYSIYASPLHDAAGQIAGNVAVLVDISERKGAEEERQAHLWFLESLDQVNRAIQGADDLKQMMGDVLDAVLSIFACDRAWLVYPCDPEAASWHVPMERTRPEFPGAFALGLEMPMDPDIATVLQTVRAASGPVRFGPGAEHPLPAAVSKIFHIQSQIAMAVYPKIDSPYVFGLHQCSYPRVWTPEEERLFQEIGRRLGDALTSLLTLRNLRESERRLEEAQRMAHVGWWERDLDDDLITWSDEIYRIFGLSPQDRILNLAQYEELVHPEDRSIIAQIVAETLRGNPDYDVEYRIVRPNGEVRFVHSQGHVIQDESGRPRRTFGMLQDITEHKRVEAALRASERRLAEAERIAHVGWWERDLDSDLLTWSEETCRIFGLPTQERVIHFARLQQLIHPADRPLMLQAVTESLQGGPRYDVEYRIVRPNGETRFVRSQGDATWDESGRPCRVFGVIQDITELRQAERDLRASEARFRTFVDHATDAFILHDDQGTILDVNRYACESLGYTREELIGMSPLAFDSDVTPSFVEQLQARLAAGEVVAFDTYHRRKDGTVFPVEVRIRSFWEGGRRFSVSLVRNITNRKRAEELQDAVYRIAEATSSVESLDDLFHAVHKIIKGVMPADNFYIALYDEKEDLLSFPYFVDQMDVSSPPQRPGKGLTDYVLRTGKPLLCNAALHEELMRRGEAELVGVSSPIWLGVPLKIEDKTIGVMAVQHYADAQAYGEREKEMLAYVSSQVAKAIERKQAEQALVESYNLLNAVVEGTSDIVFVKDSQGRYLMINSAGAHFLGKTVAEVIGKDDLELCAPDDARAIMARDRQLMTSGESQVFEQTVTGAEGTRIYLTTKGVFRDAEGKVLGLIGSLRDVTELKRLEEQFRQAQKMEAVGRLAGGVAHDFNNLLTVINGYSELVFNRLRPDDPNRKPLAEIQKAGERAANLTRQLLAVSRKQMLQPQVVSLNTLLGDLLKLLQPLLGEDIELALVPDARLGLAKVDPGQFEQAIINLAVNARDAMPQGGRLTIETHNIELDETYARRHPEVKAGSYLLVAVSDSGHGMDKVTMSRIFEPFFTTKEPGKGTGLGLAMVYGFVKQSGGHIEVYSEVGYGTTFKVYLPCADETTPTAKSSPDLLKIPKGAETILLVEDENAVRTLSKLILQSSGYTVLEAQEGEEAVRLAHQFPGPIHLLVTDVVMPRMSGRQLAEQLVQAKPHLRTLFISGYTDEAVLRHGVLEANVAFLQKPFNPIDLAHKVREVLDGEA